MSFDPSLASLGWDADWARAFAPFSSTGLAPARVAAEHRSRYVLATDRGERTARLAGRLRADAADAADVRPAVGDWVAAALPADGDAAIHAVVPRRTALVRRAAGQAARAQVVAANVDVAAVVAPLSSRVNPRWLERFVAVAWESGATPLVVLTKADTCADVPAAIAEASLAAPGVSVVAVSALAATGLDGLAAFLAPGRTLALLGASGAGKSTLVNRLLGREHMATAAVREDGKGRHTTSHRESVRLASGALLVDTPGVRALAPWDADAGVEATFADVESAAAGCRFADCAHAGEPGCAVGAAVEAGALDAERLAAWRALRRELAHLARQVNERAAAEAKAHTKLMTRAQTRFLRDRGR